MPYGEVRLYPLGIGQEATVEATPARGFDLGEGKGKTIHKKVAGGVVGLAFDTRGRPLVLPENKDERVRCLNKWAKAMDLYPE
jgi:hypothetical protein